MEPIEVQLPSGRVLTMRTPNAKDHWLTQEHLPDYDAEPSAPPPDTKAATQAMIVLICACTVKPRLWCDLRPFAVRTAEPLNCPPGFEEFDLDLVDMAHATVWLTERMKQQVAAVRPTAGTAAD